MKARYYGSVELYGYDPARDDREARARRNRIFFPHSMRGRRTRYWFIGDATVLLLAEKYKKSCESFIEWMFGLKPGTGGRIW